MTQTEALNRIAAYPFSRAEELTAEQMREIAREALAQPVQEPVGEVSKAGFGDYPVICWRKGYVAKIGDKFYTTPPQRKPLTDEVTQIAEALRRHGLTLVKTAKGYDVMNLGQITAHGIKE